MVAPIIGTNAPRNTSTPIATSTVQNHFTSKENTCATIAEPTSAPRMTASASGSVIRPRPANEASSSVVAVELCRMPVTPIPAKNAPIDQMKSQMRSGMTRIHRNPTVSRQRCRSSVTTTRIGCRFGSGGVSPPGSGSMGGGSKTIQPALMPEQLTRPGPVSYPLRT